MCVWVCDGIYGCVCARMRQTLRQGWKIKRCFYMIVRVCRYWSIGECHACACVTGQETDPSSSWGVHTRLYLCSDPSLLLAHSQMPGKRLHRKNVLKLSTDCRVCVQPFRGRCVVCSPPLCMLHRLLSVSPHFLSPSK